MSTFYYEGDAANSWTWSEFCTGGNCYFPFNVDVVILYGNYINSDNLSASQPVNLPPLTGVNFNVKIHRFINNLPADVDSTPTLINTVPIYSPDNPHSCIGTKFTFATRVFNSDCSREYCLVWSTSKVEMPYGADMIFVPAMNGVGYSFEPCD